MSSIFQAEGQGSIQPSDRHNEMQITASQYDVRYICLIVKQPLMFKASSSDYIHQKIYTSAVIYFIVLTMQIMMEVQNLMMKHFHVKSFGKDPVKNQCRRYMRGRS